MFTTPCFIRKNNKGLRNKLKGLGYTECMTIGDLSCIVISNNNDCWNGSFDLVSSDVIDNIRFRKHHVDCGKNEDLFLAIAALRNDSDYMQWLTCAEVPEFTLCTKNSIDEHFMDSFPNELYRKATVEELIKHFK